jgi:hypothetical protein
MFFREDWKELAAATPVTQEHVGHPDLIMSLHGPGKLGIKKSHHEKPTIRTTSGSACAKVTAR